MKKNGYQMLVLLTLLCSMLLLSACTAEAAAGEDTAAPAAEEQTEPTLESLLGEDYVDYLTETITMQMGNRMDKDPEVQDVEDKFLEAFGTRVELKGSLRRGRLVIPFRTTKELERLYSLIKSDPLFGENE